jgi:GMP synthase (glutamine-hydrolysing)
MEGGRDPRRARPLDGHFPATLYCLKYNASMTKAQALVMHPRRSAVALRHVAFEDLGLLAPIMERAGWNVAFCEAAVDDLSHRSIRDADLVIVLGGPIGVYETEDYPFLTTEIALIEYRLSHDLPTLGICLGSQLMAKALGSRVFKGPVKESAGARSN